METELILNADGSVYHLGLRPEQACRLVITVGDPARVAQVSRHFDAVSLRQQRREFTVHAGTLAGRPIMCVSTGIGTDNVDIVLQELDALLNVDFSTREPRGATKQMTFVRLGTSGTPQADLAVDSVLVSSRAIGLDGLGPSYGFPEHALATSFGASFPDLAAAAYGSNADRELLRAAAKLEVRFGSTLTCAGFYGPQRRSLRLKFRGPSIDELAAWRTDLGPARKPEHRIDNFEMETAGIYGLAGLLGHRAISFSAVLANRVTGEFSERATATVDSMIERVLGAMLTDPRTWWSVGS